MKPDTFSLLYLFVIIFGFDPAQATIGLEKCWSNWPIIETFPLNYSARSVNVKQGLRKVVALPT